MNLPLPMPPPPCPFCSSTAHVQEREEEGGNYRISVRSVVVCDSCSAEASPEDWYKRAVNYRRQNLTVSVEDGKPIAHFQVPANGKGDWVHISDIPGLVT